MSAAIPPPYVGSATPTGSEGGRDPVERRSRHVGGLHSIGHRGEESRFEDYDRDFRDYHTKTYASSGAYDVYAPAYRYGYEIGNNRSYQGRDWSSIESDARRDWEAKNPGTWEKMKDAVRYSWDRVRQGAHNVSVVMARPAATTATAHGTIREALV